MDAITTENRIGNHYINIMLAVIGMLLACAGNLMLAGIMQKYFYCMGAAFLFTSALLERQGFFILLQLIVLVGTLCALTHFSAVSKASLPIGLSILSLAYLASTGALRQPLTLLGALGIALLAAGYAVTNPYVYFFGALVLAIYSSVSYVRGVTIALLWALLNALFVLTAAVTIYHSFSHYVV